MRTIHVIGVVGKGSGVLVDEMVHIFPGVPIFSDTPGRVSATLSSLFDMMDELKDTGLSDMANILDSMPMVVYVCPMTLDTELAIAAHPGSEAISIHTIATEEGHEYLSSLAGVATSGVTALETIARQANVRK